MCISKNISIPAVCLAATQFCSAVTVLDHVGASAFWASGGGGYGITWSAVGGNDTADLGSKPEFDFVGDPTNRGIFYSTTADYLFFRMRVNEGSAFPTTLATSPGGAYALLIDIITDPSPSSTSGVVAPNLSAGVIAPKVGATAFTGQTGIDYAFSWDSASHISSSHGLEMSIAGTKGGINDTWGDSALEDIDGNGGLKGAIDINGNSRTTDGYVRTTDNQATTNFGTTTFIDFAVKWSYLTTYTLLNAGQTWNITVADITTGNDHKQFDGDVYGGSLTSTLATTSWSGVPEPTTALAGLLLGAGLLRRRRH